MVYTLCLKVVKSPEVAEEAAQDTFVKAYRNLSRFEKRSSLKTWLYRIAYHTAIDYARKKKNRLPFKDGMSFESTTPNAAEIMQEKEKAQIIRTSVARLSEDERTVITLYYLQEMSIREIAEITDWTHSNIKIKLFRARKNLRKILEGKPVNPTS